MTNLIKRKLWGTAKLLLASLLFIQRKGNKLAHLVFNFHEMYWVQDAPTQILTLIEFNVIVLSNLIKGDSNLIKKKQAYEDFLKKKKKSRKNVQSKHKFIRDSFCTFFYSWQLVPTPNFSTETKLICKNKCLSNSRKRWIKFSYVE